MKKIYLCAIVAAMFAACSNEDLSVAEQPKTTEVNDGAIRFDAYTQRALTRANDINLDALKADGKGFGVFAYYTDNNSYDGLSTPNFMYNEHVTFADPNWTYAPVKYWPNEFGPTAQAEETDKVSFFAYAPWVDVTPATGKLAADYGITGLSRNSAAGDPLVKYVVTLDPSKAVDLCWGVCDESAWAAQGGAQTMVPGKPWIDVTHPGAIEQKMKFQFKHALAKLNVQVDAFVDGIDNTHGLEAGTKIYIRSISFTGFAMKGALNLNNTQANTPLWLDYAGANDLETGEELTIFDGRKDGKEGVAEASNEKVTGLNTVLIQNTSETDGVTNSPVNLFQGGADEADAIYVIPTGDRMSVTIVYDVETADDNLATYLSDGVTNGSSVENRITKEIVFEGGITELAAGKRYQLKLHLGMTSVKLDADVTAWEDPEIVGDADLPFNMPIYTAGAAGAGQTITVPASATSYEFAVNGFAASEALTWTSDVASLEKDASANLSGYAKAKGTFAANTTTSNVSPGHIKVEGTSKEYDVIIQQLAAALDFSAAEYSDADHTVTCTIGNADVTELNAAGITVTMKKDGGDFTDFTLAESKVITLTSYDAGTYSVTIKANDAESVTVNFTID